MKIGNLVLGIFCLMLCSCTANCRAKNFGGKMAIDLPCDQKLFDVTWKEDNLWYAMRPMEEVHRQATSRERFVSVLVLVFAATALGDRKAQVMPAASLPAAQTPVDPEEAERCKVPEFAKAMGHEEKWKLHNNCL